MSHRKSKHGVQMGRGMLYRDTERDQVGGQEPEYLQPRIPQHSHLDVCFSPLPSGVPRPSGPAERGHRVGGLFPAVLIHWPVFTWYLLCMGPVQGQAGQEGRSSSTRKSCYVADHIVRTHAMQRSMRGKCHMNRELETVQPWSMGMWSPMKGRRIALDKTSMPLSRNGILGHRLMQQYGGEMGSPQRPQGS